LFRVVGQTDMAKLTDKNLQVSIVNATKNWRDVCDSLKLKKGLLIWKLVRASVTSVYAKVCIFFLCHYASYTLRRIILGGK
jgi:hypothetical protein